MPLPALFLFQTGSIKSTSFAILLAYRDSFYSRLVRLKAIVLDRDSNGFWGFLFQTGSIKSIGSSMAFHRVLQFLFQTGSIKRGLPRLPHLTDRGFYSRLVRLKGKRNRKPARKKTCFYSRLVRLKVWKPATYRPLDPVGFYSRLVRLKELARLSDSTEDAEVSIPDWFD